MAPQHDDQNPVQSQQTDAPAISNSDNDNNEAAAAETLQQPLLSSSLPPSSPPPNDGGSDDQDDDQVSTTSNKDIVIGSFRMNHNVFLNLVLAVLYGISNSLWNGTAYAAYLKKLGGDSNEPLGNIEAASGAASLVTALPIGYLADKIGRSKVIRVGGILLLLTCILQICVMEWVGTDETDDDFDHLAEADDDTDETGDGDGTWFVAGSFSKPFFGAWRTLSSTLIPSNGMFGGSTSEHTTEALWMMGALMVLWGLADGVVGGPCQALFADSVPEGERTSAYNSLFVCYCASSACGPLVSIILFQTLGDQWDLVHLRTVIYVGLGLEIFNSFLMMLFDDDKALDEECDDDGQEEESVHVEDERNGIESCEETLTAPNSSDTTSSGDGDQQRTDETSNQNDVSRSRSTTTAADADDNDTELLRKRQRWIPYLVFFQGLIFAVGSGMTVKFFPLFFKDEVGMTPSQVQIIYTIVPAVMVVASTACTKISGAGFGRVQTMLLFSCLGVSLLYAMVLFKGYLDSHPFLLVPIYVLRTALMNATYPIQESILMDFVPKNERARWKSLDSVASFGWCGSAALGGWIADKYDYTYTFLITAILQSCGIVVWSFLLPLVPRKEGTRVMDATDSSNNSRRSETRPSSDVDSLTQPLLAGE